MEKTKLKNVYKFIVLFVFLVSCFTYVIYAATGDILPDDGGIITDAKITSMITGTAPLSASNNITVKNHFFPRTLFTLVAPVEPEPTVLISCPVFALTTKYPVGIDPIIYAITTVKTKSNIALIILPPF